MKYEDSFYFVKKGELCDEIHFTSEKALGTWFLGQIIATRLFEQMAESDELEDISKWLNEFAESIRKTSDDGDDDDDEEEESWQD